METVYRIKEICSLLLDDKKHEARHLANNALPFDNSYNVKEITEQSLTLIQIDELAQYQDLNESYNEKSKGGYAKNISKVLLRDGFVDRYTGKQLLFPGILFLLHY